MRVSETSRQTFDEESYVQGHGPVQSPVGFYYPHAPGELKRFIYRHSRLSCVPKRGRAVSPVTDSLGISFVTLTGGQR